MRHSNTLTPSLFTQRCLAVLAILVGLFSLTACEHDDDEGGNASNTGGNQSRSACSTTPRSSLPQLRREDRWLIDNHGRVVLIHGQNLVWKHAPYVPPDSPDGFTAADADWLKEHGFNGARIGVLWVGVTPEAPGVVDENYLQEWDRVIQLLADRGIWMQFDFHQDLMHETYGGEGVPAWAFERPAPFSAAPPLDAGFPGTYFTPEMSMVFDQFLANTNNVWDGWAAAWQAVASRWQHQPYSMGYDLLNEPWPGQEWPECLFTGCPDTYVNELQPAFEHVLSGIRAVDPEGIVWFEPQQLAGGRGTPTFFEAVPDEDQLGYSWHNYCPNVFFESQGVPQIPGQPPIPGAPIGPVSECEGYSDAIQRDALAEAVHMHAVGVMSEFGATDNLEALAIDTAVADRYFTNWMHWAYKFWNDPTTADDVQGLFEDDSDLSSVKQGKLAILERAYPQATAGIPKELSFDPDTAEFHYRYTARAASADTEIYIPAIHYPDGYRVEVTGAKVVSAANARKLVLANDACDEEVTVAVMRP